MKILLSALLLPALFYGPFANAVGCAVSGVATTTVCKSSDGKFGIVLDDEPTYKVDFPDGLYGTQLCKNGVTLNGKLLHQNEFQISESVSSLHGLSVEAPNKSIVKVNAIFRISGLDSDWPNFPALPGTEGVEVLVQDFGPMTKATMYKLNSDGVNSTPITLVCGPATL